MCMSIRLFIFNKLLNDVNIRPPGRDYHNLKLKESALQTDSIGCIGGVECSVLATTEDYGVALAYSNPGSFILEIKVGQVDRGADV